jgi:non-ribosomal peptide synthase protein (TIGR01720 family)
MYTVRLDAAQTEKVIHTLPRALGLGAVDLLLTAYLQAVGEWIGDTDLLVNFSGHGRAEMDTDLDLSRTVGWFTAVYPVRFELGSGVGLAERAHAVHRRLAEVPNLGAGYGVLRYLRKDQVARNLRSARPPQMSFVYLGEFRSSTAEDPSSGTLSRLVPLEARRGSIVDTHFEYPLSLSISVTDGELKASWIHRADLIATETVQSLAASWADAILQAGTEEH